MKVDHTQVKTETHAVDLLNYPRLDTVSWDQLKTGDRVQSVMTGTLGTITEKNPIEYATRLEDNELIIDWDNNNRSWVWHFQTVSVVYLGIVN